MKTIRIEDAPEPVKQFLEGLDVSREEVVCEQAGKPWMVMVSPNILEKRRQAKERLFEVIDRIRNRNPALDSEKVLEDLEAMNHP